MKQHIGSIKANTVDRYLLPIRLQIKDLIKPDSNVMEYGCGNGDLLFKLSDKIKTGKGIDKSEPLIARAQRRMEKEAVPNLSFQIKDLTKAPFHGPMVDYSIASLLFHTMAWPDAKQVLETMIASSKTTIVCGFSEPERTMQSLLLWLDQRFTGHYRHYAAYRDHGFTEGLLQSFETLKVTRYDTFDPVIKIYKIINENIE